jgi:hypothetical protein
MSAEGVYRVCSLVETAVPGAVWLCSAGLHWPLPPHPYLTPDPYETTDRTFVRAGCSISVCNDHFRDTFSRAIYGARMAAHTDQAVFWLRHCLVVDRYVVCLFHCTTWACTNASG